MATAWASVDLVGGSRTGANPEAVTAQASALTTGTVSTLSGTAPDTVVVLHDALVSSAATLATLRDSVVAARATLQDKHATLVEKVRTVGLLFGGQG